MITLGWARWSWRASASTLFPLETLRERTLLGAQADPLGAGAMLLRNLRINRIGCTDDLDSFQRRTDEDVLELRGHRL